MIIAEQLKQKNLAEYLLYLWQVEDLIRAYKANISDISSHYIERIDGVSPERKEAMQRWYQMQIDIMKAEGVMLKGHTTASLNVLKSLENAQHALELPPSPDIYDTTYKQALPLIVELRAMRRAKRETAVTLTSSHSQASEDSEVATALELVYGVRLLMMKGKPISPETQDAMSTLLKWLYLLSDKALSQGQTV